MKLSWKRWMSWSLVLVMLVLIVPLQPAAGSTSTISGIYTQAQIDFVKAKVSANEEPWKSAYDKLIADANAWASETPSAVATWSVPAYYVDASGHESARNLMLNDAKAAYANALAYVFTGNSSYANVAVNIINDWASTNTSITGDDGVLVGAYVGVGLLMAAEWIRDYSGWTSTDQAVFDTWLQSVYLRDVNTSYYNNWGDWVAFARLTAYHLLGSSSGFDTTVDRLETIIDSSIDANGFLPHETSRGKNGMWYTYFSLAPKTAASQLVYNVTGENLFDGKLDDAVDTFFTYVQNPSAWPYHSSPSFPSSFSSTSWPLNLYEAMGGIYGRSDYTDFVDDYRPLNGPFNSGQYHHFAWFYPTLFYNTLNVGSSTSPVEVIVDNADGAGYVNLTGDWTSSSNTAGFYGNDYLHDMNTGKGTKFAEFIPDVPSDGNYAVYLRWCSYSNRASNVPVTVYYDGGNASHTVNMQTGGGVWYKLGDYDLKAGQSVTNGSVKIATTGTNGFVVADAIKLVKND